MRKPHRIRYTPNIVITEDLISHHIIIICQHPNIDQIDLGILCLLHLLQEIFRQCNRLACRSKPIHLHAIMRVGFWRYKGRLYRTGTNPYGIQTIFIQPVKGIKFCSGMCIVRYPKHLRRSPKEKRHHQKKCNDFCYVSLFRFQYVLLELSIYKGWCIVTRTVNTADQDCK